MRAKGRFPQWNWGSGRHSNSAHEQTPCTQVFLWKHLIFRELLPNLGQVSWQTVPGFQSNIHPPQMIFIKKITSGQCRQTASSKQFTGFSLFFFHIKKSNLAQFDISYRNVACWLTISKIPQLDSSKKCFIWPLVVLNSKRPSRLLLQKHCTP